MKTVIRHMITAIIGFGAFFTPVQSYGASIVELYTSQGCSSCPSADLYMTELGERDDVIPLAFHVDYWDYLGWVDEMAKPEFSERQVYYQQARQEKQIFTPQVIVNGWHSFSGANTAAIENSFKLNNPAEELKMEPSQDGKLSFSAFPTNGKSYQIMLAYILPPKTVEITAGENVGKLIEYTNVVDKLVKIADWDGLAPIDVNAAPDPSMQRVVFIQEAGLGAIVFAEKLNN